MDTEFNRTFNPTDLPNLTVDEPRKTRKRRKPASTEKPSGKDTAQMNISIPAELAQQIRLAAMISNQSTSEVVEHYLTSAKKLPRYIISEE